MISQSLVILEACIATLAISVLNGVSRVGKSILYALRVLGAMWFVYAEAAMGGGRK
jgi:hypothetical protein